MDSPFGLVTAQPDAAEDQATGQPLPEGQAFAEDNDPQEHTEHRNQVGIACCAAGRNSANAVIITAVSAAGREYSQINNRQAWKRRPGGWQADTGQQEKGKEEQAADKRLQGGQQQWRIVGGQVLQCDGEAGGTGH